MSPGAGNAASTHDRGLKAEERAAGYLREKGYSVLERNFRTREGEIDIIALGSTRSENDTIVFVEVKSLPHGSTDTLSHELNSTKQQKILKTAKCYLQKHRQYNDSYIRFDVIALDVPALDPVHHIVNAFSE